ncbi:hypothetical protein EDC96DRAFT_564628 [Choanephora cucurbitarum]|nr:hypothetical protein EDC96DRAFT_564628 [Choanephora cucurbitarum]
MFIPLKSIGITLFLSIAIGSYYHLRLKSIDILSSLDRPDASTSSELGMHEFKTLFKHSVHHMMQLHPSSHRMLQKADMIYYTGLEKTEWLKNPMVILEALQNSKKLNDLTDDELVMLYEEVLEGPVPMIMFRNYTVYPDVIRVLEIIGFVLLQYIVIRLIILL